MSAEVSREEKEMLSSVSVDEFDSVVENRISSIERVLANKAKEYATGTNRMHNFSVAGRILNSTPERALFGMMLKHIVSVIDLVDQAGEKEMSFGLIDEKVGDTINYLILLETLLKKRCKS